MCATMELGRGGPETETIRTLAIACRIPFEWLNEGRGNDTPNVRTLAPKEEAWLALLEDRGTDYVEEFTAIIKERQTRNRRIADELGKGT